MQTLKLKPYLKKISRLKREHKVTNRKIARDQKVSEQWVSMILHGKGESKPLKEAIAQSLGVNIDDIFPRKAA